MLILKRVNWNIDKAARLTGISSQTLRQQLWRLHQRVNAILSGTSWYEPIHRRPRVYYTPEIAMTAHDGDSDA